MKANNARALPGRALLLLVPALLLVACGVLPKRQPIATYEPARPSAAQHAAWPSASWSLLVAKPVGGGMLDSERIAVRPAPGEVSVYMAAAWADPAPDLLQNALLRRFEDSGKILSVARPGSGVRGDFQLQTDLRVFESVYVSAGRPEAQVEIYAKLVRTSSGEVVAARSFRETQAAASENLDSVVEAFSAALGRTTEQVAGWTLQAGNAAR